jgi:hypothetical protein
VAAGGSVSVAGVALLALLAPRSRTLGGVPGHPVGTAVVLLPVPALAVQSLLWWALLEHRGNYSYAGGGAVGAAAGLVAVVLWVGSAVVRGGTGPVPTRWAALLVPFALAVALPVAFATGLALTHARRRGATGAHGDEGPRR